LLLLLQAAGRGHIDGGGAIIVSGIVVEDASD
jgi:hypothetical protein